MPLDDLVFGLLIAIDFKTRRAITKHTTKTQVTDAIIVMLEVPPMKYWKKKNSESWLHEKIYLILN